MLPSMLAEELQERLTTYLGTTFALAEDDARSSLERFLTGPETSIFRGPYLRVRLPFRQAENGWHEHLDWVPGEFTPHRHQAHAFQRLSSKNHEPEPTIVTTGTGSGKTESFLIPVLDHCLRERAAGKRGIKALVLYPMNALANDQAARIARLVAEHPELNGVTAGLITGDARGYRNMSAEHIIEEREVLRAEPPDILLTNYKMLDRLLLREDDRELWDGAGDALRYLVLDEFHTYDGAQGTDVALLLRRLGMALGLRDDDRPLGAVAPIATSATLGDGGQVGALLKFAKTVFGCEFGTDSLIREDRLGAAEWIAVAPAAENVPVGRIPLLAEFDGLLSEGREVGYDELVKHAIGAFFEGEEPAIDPGDPHTLGIALGHHPLTQAVVDATGRPATAEDVLSALAPLAPTWANSLGTGAAGQARTALAAFTALLSHARIGAPDVPRPLLHVETQLWVREITHLVRRVSSEPAFGWYDDHPAETEDRVLSAVYCRHCGRGGWGAALTGPTGGQLDDRIPEAWKMSAVRSDRFRVFLHAPGEADVDPDSVGWLDPATLEVRRSSRDDSVPVLTTPADNPKSAKQGVCPSCEKPDGMRFLGSGVSTLVSVALSHLFGHTGVPETEKKTLVFTDSVQDAAHRAGFVESRAYTFNLRSALHRAVDPDGGTRLDQLKTKLIDDVRGRDNRAQRYALLPPTLVDRDGFQSFWNDDRLRNTRRVEERMAFAAHLEFGLNSRTGRTLELTGAIGVHVDTDTDNWLATRVDKVISDNLPATLDLPDTVTPTPLAWARGILERLRTQGAIAHKFLDKYVGQGGNQWWITGGRNRSSGMPAFFRSRGPVPTFPTDAPKSEHFDSIVAPRTWFTWWTHRCLGVPEADAPRLVRALFETLAAEGVLERRNADESGGKKNSVYLLMPDRILLDRVSADRLKAGDAILRCDVCATRVPVHPDTGGQLTDAPCTVKGCVGNLRKHPEPENYYRDLYGKEKVRRIVAHEHTGLLERGRRTQIEEQFKAGGAPDAPNVLTCTPTLELGIDIGDLGVVALTSLPRSPAGYLQRVGRAGRRSGNAFIIAVLPGRAAELHHFNSPLDMIDGQVTPPACYLDAGEILRRQYFAALVDRTARRVGTRWRQPVSVPALLANALNQDRYLKRLLDDARKEADHYVTEFLESLGGEVSERTADELRAWAGADGSDDVPGIERAIQDAIDRWTAERSELTSRIASLSEAHDELEAKQSLLTNEGKTDLKRLAGELKAAHGLKKKLFDDGDWLGSLEALGLLPNYTLLDEATRLDVGLWWIEEDSNTYDIEESHYERGSRTALRELAPGATFYASRRAVRIDAVDIGSAYNSTIRSWRCCPGCGWSGPDTGPQACPRCGSDRAADTGQRIDAIPFRRVSAFAPRDEARFGDEHENRLRVGFTIATSADVDPADIGYTWALGGYPFGGEHCRKIRIRWFNLGQGDRGGTDRDIAGETHTAPLFTVCTSCGVVPAAQGKERHDVRHRGWCPQRTKPDPKGWTDVALMHELQTEALRLLVPPTVVADDSQLASFTAALKLGLRAVLGGSPDHIDAFACQEKSPAGRKQMVVLHDLVPGGTGYLNRFAKPGQVKDLLLEAKEHLEGCRCAELGQLACHRCLLAVSRPEEAELLRRDRALSVVNEILQHWNPVSGGDGIRSISSNSAETPLERRFREQLIRWAKEHKLRPQVNAGARGDRVRFSVGDSGDDRTRHWVAEPQVTIDNFVKPDFVLAPIGFVAPRIAVFCDSVRFHNSTEHNNLARDARQRARLRESGYLVWAVTHEDMETFEQVLAGHSPGRLPFLTSTQQDRFVRGANKTAGLGSVAAGKVRGDAMTLLTDYLRNPDRKYWRTVAQAIASGMAADRGPTGARKVEPAGLPEVIQRHGRGEPVDNGGERPTVLTTTANGAPLVLLPVPGERRVDAVAVLDDGSVGSVAQLACWRDWLAASNLLQLLDHNLPRFIAAVTSEQLTDDDVPGFAPKVRFNVDWRRLDGVCDEELRALLPELAAHLMPLPEPGLEFNDTDEPIGLAWPDAKLAVEYQPSAERIDQLSGLGWHVIPYEPDRTPDVRQIIDLLDPTGKAQH